MKPEDAIKELKEYYDLLNGKINGNSLLESIEIAISAIEKQIPKKPEFQYVTTNGYGSYEYVCDECGCVLSEKIDYFCPNCGQAIDWEEE